ncbi:hypothetical protein [Nocardia wallacei]|uniref:hypothetical protein n=1 Tax=Nocardia wallacei TaxID=480035 RepID=UPI0024570F11|nr:hypothetical protein [Nocardia wallacei]
MTLIRLGSRRSTAYTPCRSVSRPPTARRGDGVIARQALVDSTALPCPLVADIQSLPDNE